MYLLILNCFEMIFALDTLWTFRQNLFFNAILVLASAFVKKFAHCSP